MKNLCWTVSLALLLLFVQEAYSKVYLVSVGIADYPGRENDLYFSAEDAKTITWLYGRNPTAVVSRQLIDRQATVSAIVSAMESVFSQAGEGDRVVFFFSGHGYEGGFAAYDGSLSYSRIRAAMKKGRARTKIIFADACYSGRIRTPKKDSSPLQAKDEGVMLFLSSRSNEMSVESEGMKNGVFTAYLQKGLRGSADANRDRIITAREIYNFVHEGVVKATGGTQHPVMWGKFPDNMAVMTW